MAGIDHSALGGSYRDPAGTSSRIQFRRAITLVAMSLFVPGSAQIVQGNRAFGRFVLRVWLGVIGVGVFLGLLSVVSRSAFLTLVMNPVVLTFGRWILLALAVGWALVIFDAWRLGRPLEQKSSHRIVGTAFGTASILGTVGVLFFASHAVAVVNEVSSEVFVSGTVTKPHDGRYNILLLGADSGKDRDGLRPDSINIASIDADTGRAVLIGLPRNLQKVPFPAGSPMHKEFPQGFDCDGCYLNAVYTWAQDHQDRFDSDKPGMDATIAAIEEISGLSINYYALVNMKGFSKLVDSVGGVKINVQERTAIGGIGSPIRGWIESGEQQLTGDQALWYARSRVMNDDWSRMGRQKCVINAMVQQLNPQKVLLNMNEIAKSGSAMVTTSIPRQDMSVFMDLALETRKNPISSVSIVPPLINTADPDYAKVRRLIETGIYESETAGETRAKLETVTLKAIDLNPSVKEPKKANQSKDLGSSC